ncbi:MAG: YraN family protein [Chloroflexi bacterium]|nr:YraN family protein [Chloroflexota bacterium]MYD47278.1 YraN family protein [Chloroflexota bacterium]
MPSDDEKPNAGLTPHQVGNIGERLARSHLEAKGYHIVDANYRCRWGEIDLIARYGPVWVFVEVRTRRGDAYGTPEESVTESKAKRLVLTAQDYLRRQTAASSEAQWRIDLIAIRLGKGRRVLDLRHLENIVEG